MTLENFSKFFNEELYPSIYPYYLQHNLRCENNKLSLVVKIAKTDNIVGADFDIDKDIKYKYEDLLILYGDSDQEVIDLFNKIDINNFSKIWDK